MIDLRRRSAQPELMDAEATDLATVEACLRDLERINRWTGAYRITLRWLERVLDRHRPTRPLVVVDVGSGYGDMLRRIAAFAERRGVAVDLIGVDLNPHASVAAARATPPQYPIRYLTQDVFDLAPPVRPDVVISALFAHHLDDPRLVRFLHWMDERAGLGWLINDPFLRPDLALRTSGPAGWRKERRRRPAAAGGKRPCANPPDRSTSSRREPMPCHPNKLRGNDRQAPMLANGPTSPSPCSGA